MEITKTPLDGLLIFKPEIFSDSRGYFMETFRQQIFEKLGMEINFVQDNQSISSKGVLRGMHFQKAPHEQGKLVRVISGSVLDVAVDIRKESPTYKNWFSIELSGSNHLILWIPKGFAHGFLSLEDNTIFSYKCTAYYHPEYERSFRYDDPEVGIKWGHGQPVLSERDSNLENLNNIDH